MAPLAPLCLRLPELEPSSKAYSTSMKPLPHLVPRVCVLAALGTWAARLLLLPLALPPQRRPGAVSHSGEARAPD